AGAGLAVAPAARSRAMPMEESMAACYSFGPFGESHDRACQPPLPQFEEEPEVLRGRLEAPGLRVRPRVRGLVRLQGRQGPPRLLGDEGPGRVADAHRIPRQEPKTDRRIP